MEGDLPPAESTTGTGALGEGTDSNPDSKLGPAYAVLKALVGDGIPSGRLSSDNVPAKVLGIPIKRAMQALIEHRKECKKVRCPRVPAPLWQYQNWRDEAIATLGDQINKVLWTHPTHEFIDRIRKRIIAENPDLAKEVLDGHLFTGNTLDSVIGSEGATGARRLTALLWAFGFESPSVESLFRILVPVADEAAKLARKLEPETTKKSGSRDRELRDANRDRKLAHQAAEKASEEVRAKDKALSKAADELEDSRQKYLTASEQLELLESRLREAETARHIMERDGERVTKSNEALRQDLRETRESLKDLEVKRSDLARQIAFERRYAEQFKQEHKTGAPAVWEFLEKEHERIRIEQIITSGGQRQRANNEWTAHRKFREGFLGAYPDYVQDDPPPKVLPKTSMRFVALGGSNEIGRSCYLLELGKHRILVDCGIKPGVPNDLRPDLDQLKRIDALLLTHAHTDHIGWIPALVRKFGEFEIYCSEATAGLLPIMLDDCRRHYIRKITTARERARHIRNADLIPEEYEDQDVRNIPNLVITCPFGQQLGLSFGGATIRFYPAGHILGAASILLEDQSGRRVFFSGDFSSFDQLTVPAAAWPSDLGEVDLLVLESTYGDRPRHPPLEASQRELINFVRDTVTNRQGSVILASFALGRAQELLSLLALARKNGELPASVPVHIDGMINKINPVYQETANNFDIQQQGFLEVSGTAERRDVLFEAQTKPTIIVTTSGMMNGGPVIEYARQLLSDGRNRIVFSGYQDETAPSRALLELERAGLGKRVVEVLDESGETIRIEAAVPAKHASLSAHADQAGLIEYANRLSPKVIALVHGNPVGQERLGFLLQQTHPDARIVAGSEIPVAVA